MHMGGIYTVEPVSLPSGKFAADWFDDDRSLWEDERLFKCRSLLASWRAPKLTVRLAGCDPTPVLFNPNAYAVSASVRAGLSRSSGLEFLPIDIVGFGQFFVLHPVAAYELPPDAVAQRAPLYRGNIVNVIAFPESYVPETDFFGVRHPADSPAGRAGSRVQAMFTTDRGAQVLEAACGEYLVARELVHA